MFIIIPFPFHHLYLSHLSGPYLLNVDIVKLATLASSAPIKQNLVNIESNVQSSSARVSASIVDLPIAPTNPVSSVPGLPCAPAFSTLKQPVLANHPAGDLSAVPNAARASAIEDPINFVSSNPGFPCAPAFNILKQPGLANTSAGYISDPRSSAIEGPTNTAASVAGFPSAPAFSTLKQPVLANTLEV